MKHVFGCNPVFYNLILCNSEQQQQDFQTLQLSTHVLPKEVSCSESIHKYNAREMIEKCDMWWLWEKFITFVIWRLFLPFYQWDQQLTSPLSGLAVWMVSPMFCYLIHVVASKHECSNAGSLTTPHSAHPLKHKVSPWSYKVQSNQKTCWTHQLSSEEKHTPPLHSYYAPRHPKQGNVLNMDHVH